MGKKAKFKQLRRIANQLPEILVESFQLKEVVTGAELIKSGVTEVKGTPVHPHLKYKQREVAQKPMNHHRKMKQMYNQYGPAGVGAYLEAVDDYMLNQQKPVEEEKPIQ